MNIIKYPDDTAVNTAISEKEPMLVLISFDGKTAVISQIFQCGKEALHTGIIVAMGSTAEALNEPICYKFPAEGVACVLAATVAVKDSSVEPAVLLTKLFYGIPMELLLARSC